MYDGANLIGEYSASNALLRRYVHGPGLDTPLVRYDGTGTTNRRWLIADERGSVVAETNASGAAAQVNTYDEYGQPGAGNTSRFGYTGQMWIAEIGLYHYRNRVYNPRLGRFMQTDPIGQAGGLNLYAYVGNDPINYTDPWGLYLEVIQVHGSRFGWAVGGSVLSGFDTGVYIPELTAEETNGVCDLHLLGGGGSQEKGNLAIIPSIDFSQRLHPDVYEMASMAALRITDKLNSNPEYFSNVTDLWNVSSIVYDPDLRVMGQTNINSIAPVLKFGPFAVSMGEVELTIGHEIGHHLPHFRDAVRRSGGGLALERRLDMWAACHFGGP